MAAILFCPETGFNREDIKRNYGIFRVYRILLDLIYVRALLEPTEAEYWCVIHFTTLEFQN